MTRFASSAWSRGRYVDPLGEGDFRLLVRACVSVTTHEGAHRQWYLLYMCLVPVTGM